LESYDASGEISDSFVTFTEMAMAVWLPGCYQMSGFLRNLEKMFGFAGLLIGGLPLLLIAGLLGLILGRLRSIQKLMLLQAALLANRDAALDATGADLVVENMSRKAVEKAGNLNARASLFMLDIERMLTL